MSTSPKRIIAILEEAKSIITHDGWWGQGQACSSEPDAPGVCATGAVAVATGDLVPVHRTKNELVFDTSVISVEQVSQEYLDAVQELGKDAAERLLREAKREGTKYDAQHLKYLMEQGIRPRTGEGLVVSVNDNAERRASVTTLFNTTINRLKRELETA